MNPAPGLQSCSSSHLHGMPHQLHSLQGVGDAPLYHLHGVPQKVPPHHDSHSGAVKISEIEN